MTGPSALSAEELLHLNLPNKRTELVRGMLVVREPAGYRHGSVAAIIGRKIGAYVAAHALGDVVAAETGFKLASNPDTVRAPDVAFVAKHRLPATPPAGYATFPPDLVVEVLSPDDRPGEVRAKVRDWLTAGVALVWVVDPARREARVYRGEGTEARLADTDALEGEAVLPGFVCPLASVF